MDNKIVKNRKLRGTGGTPFYPNTQWSAIVDAPSQEGQGGKFLTTDGNVLSFGNIPENVQSDWNENDPTKNDYIKNKPIVPDVFSGTTAYWNGRVGYVPPADSIIIYTDYYSEVVDGATINYPNIKIGSGNGYVQDLAFIGQHEAELLLSHINNSTIHVTSSDKTNWNRKLNVNDSQEVVNETLIFNRN